MTNPFEDPDGSYFVLVNEEGQHSLWPTFVDVPAGWTVVHGPDSRQPCLDYVTEHWTDMRPKSLIAAMERAEPAGACAGPAMDPTDPDRGRDPVRGPAQAVREG